jgi:hypothetical protein
MWTTLSIIAIIGLVLFWRGMNPVWGSLTLGFIGGLIAATVYFFMDRVFLWSIVGKWCVVCVVIAFAGELARGAWKRFGKSN